LRKLIQCLFDAPEADALEIARAVGTRSATEVHSFIVAVHKSVGALSTRAAPLLYIDVGDGAT